MKKKTGKKKLITFQGARGAYSDLACHRVFPGYDDAALHGIRRRLRRRSQR